MKAFLLGGVVLFAALPATSNYQLNSYGFGSGGTASSTTSTYAIEGTTGDLSGSGSSTANNQLKPGFIQTEQANVPQVTVDNGSGIYYNKLHFVLSPNSHDPSDAKYLIAVTTTSTTNMNTASGVTYVQPDGTLSSTLNTSDYQTYSAWGSGSGSNIIGLTPSTTYYVATRATQGKFTESAYGPVVSQATAAPSITFSLNTNTVNFGQLTPDNTTITAAAQTITTTLTTNGASGGDVYVNGKNGGLKSSSTGGLISSVSNDLSALNDGFGAQSSGTGACSGGPFNVISPYGVSGTQVGIIDTTTRSVYSASGPITGCTGTLTLKAKAARTDIAANDYQEILTFVASANF